MSDLSRFIGLPYAQPFDCYGLVREALREVAGIDLPALQYSEDAAERAALLTAGLPGWTPVSHPIANDVIVLRHNGRPAHVGLYLGGGRFLHVNEGATSRIDRLGPRWAVESFHRYTA